MIKDEAFDYKAKAEYSTDGIHVMIWVDHGKTDSAGIHDAVTRVLHGVGCEDSEVAFVADPE